MKKLERAAQKARWRGWSEVLYGGAYGDLLRNTEAYMNAKLYTKVADNRVGAAEKTVLSDDETVALWDKLLGGLKFRVQVPGAPVGSYYYPAQ